METKPISKLYETLKNGTSKSLLKEYLTEAVYEELKDKKTPKGGTLVQCINTGVVNLDSSVGIMACDVDAYKTFSSLFDPIIKAYHKVPQNVAISHPSPTFGDINNLPFGDLDPTGEYIVSTRVRVGRSVAGKAFPPSISDAERREIESKAQGAFATLPDGLKGKYYPLSNMTEAEEKQLIEDHFLFKRDDRFNEAAGVYRSWPDGRGIFHNSEKTFLVWLNEEDHLRIISMQQKGNLGEVYKRLVIGINHIENALPFAKDGKLGNITFCPTNLGTGLRASVHIKIPKLHANQELLKQVCEKNGIQPRGIHGEHTESVGGVYDVSNKRRLGLTEIDALKEMAIGVEAIIAKEKSL